MIQNKPIADQWTDPKKFENSNHQPLPGHDILRVDSFTFEWIELETKKE